MTFPKDPSSLEPFGFDWTPWLAEIDAAETITASTWTVTGSDAALTVTAQSIVTGNLKTQVKVSAGTVGVRYTITNHITTSSGFVDERSFLVAVQQR